VPTISQAAAQLGCSVDTIRRKIRSGDLKAHKIGRTWEIELPQGTEPPASSDTQTLERLVEHLHGEIGELRRQLAIREKEVGQLHVLLGQAQSQTALTAPERPWWRRWW